MATAFETQQQAAAHANNILRQNGDDPFSEGVTKFMEERLKIYPGPYRTAFREVINGKKKWSEKRKRFTNKKK